MPYQITITHTAERTTTKPRQWTKIGTKEVERNPRFIEADQTPTRIEDDYGYTPEVQSTETVTEKIFEQTVGDLNLNAVIKAINGI